MDKKKGCRKESLELVDLNNDPFQRIMAKAGSHGRFQLIYNLVFIMGLSVMGAMIYMNIVLVLYIPDHWCYVPGREKTNLTISQWRNLTLPMIKDNRGTETYSNCEMYDANFMEINNLENWNSRYANITACKNGWTYDRTWFNSTIPTRENWVCLKDMYVTNIFVTGRIAEVLGSFVLGQMGDIFGRRFVLYLSVIFCVSGRLLSILITSYYMWFLVLSCLCSLAINSLFQSPHIIGMEISRDKERSKIAMYHSFGWSLGITIVPLLFWWLRDWELFMWISTLPTVAVLLFFKFSIESPRWLISRKRFREAIEQFNKISKINGCQFDMTESQLAEIFSQTKQETTFGIAQLFSGWRLARNTSIIAFFSIECLAWSIHHLFSRFICISYFTVILFGSAMSGNPFLNFFLQSVAEIPAYFIGKYLGDKLGRRFANCLLFFISFLTCLPIIFLATEQSYEFVIMILVAFIKFLNAAVFFTATLQGMEVYPTCMRQTGFAFSCSLGNVAGVLAPYMVYLSSNVDIRSPYYILGVLFVMAAVSALFLPETLYRKLPDTLEEARQFGIKDKFFSFPKSPVNGTNSATETEAMENLNQSQYAP
ncbi:organic cation/carnitine transporter 2-like [Cochliomyia hominivorax]